MIYCFGQSKVIIKLKIKILHGFWLQRKYSNRLNLLYLKDNEHNYHVCINNFNTFIKTITKCHEKNNSYSGLTNLSNGRILNTH